MESVSEQPRIAPSAPRWLLKMEPAFKDDDRYIFKKTNGEIHWQSNPGPQTWTMLCPYDEILLGGARGGGKSSVIAPWFARGDLRLPNEDPARASFLNDRDYRGLLLREQYQDLRELVDEFMDFFRPFGCKATGDPVVFEFKSGAKIYTNHLNSPDAFNKYRGWNITRIAVEELTTIPLLRQYLRLFGSMRSKERVRGGKVFPKLKTQLLATTNPDGDGHEWVKERFVKVLGGGKVIPNNTPMLDTITKKTRIFIPARLADNPFLSSDNSYLGTLMTATADDHVLRAQWIEGDWDAKQGAYFKNYRPNGPLGQEEADKFPWARHIPLQAPVLKPWWFRWGSGDWGYDHPAAFHKFCRNESDGRIHVYDELVLRQVGSHELGRTIARWWRDDLEKLPDHAITLYFSHEAFAKEDSGPTRAEQVAQGIKDILGPSGALVLKYSENERKLAETDPKAAIALFEQRRREVGDGLCITLRPSYRDRVGRHTYMRELFRFRPSLPDLAPDPNHLKNLFEQRGLEAYEMELKKYRQQKPEVLPKVQIWAICKGADRCIQAAQHDDPPKSEDVKKFDAIDGYGGDDELDSLSSGLIAYKEIETVIPQSYWVAERISQAQEQHSAAFGAPITDINRLYMIQRRQEQIYEGQHPAKGGTFTAPRQSSMRHRVQ